MNVRNRDKESIWNRGRATLFSIIGFYVLAWLCFTIHFVFFQYLDRRILVNRSSKSVFKSTTIPQSYVTTISLVLVTAFRAALVGSVATCYTQYLWSTFRRKAHKVKVIEDLFQIQENAFRLANYTLLRSKPTMMAIVAFCWLAPIAMTFPPGSLVVELLAQPVALNSTTPAFRNVNDWMTAEPDADGYMNGFIATYMIDPSNETPLDDKQNWRNRLTWVSFTKASLKNMVELTLINGEIRALNRQFGENSTYYLEFWGPHLQCSTVYREVHNLVDMANLETAYSSFLSFDVQLGIYESFDYVYSGHVQSFNRRQWRPRDQYTVWPCDDFQVLESTGERPFPNLTLVMGYEETECVPSVVKYEANISYSRGIQHVAYTKTDESLSMPLTQTFRAFNGTLSEWFRMTDAMHLFSLFTENLPHFSTYIQGQLYLPTKDVTYGNLSTENGSIVKTCEAEFFESNWMTTTRQALSEKEALQVFVSRAPENTPLRFDEAFLNEALMNVTINVLSLNKWMVTANGTETRVLNVYHFKNKPAFFVPYALCLGLAIPIAALGLASMHENDVSAITGGFLQVLMTTSGQTSLREAAQKCSIGGHENVSKELEEMEVRFGELIEHEEYSVKEKGVSSESNVAEDQTDNDETGAATFQEIETSEEAVPRTEDISTSLHSSSSTKGSAFVVTSLIEDNGVRWRAGFGTMEETRPLRRVY